MLQRWGLFFEFFLIFHDTEGRDKNRSLVLKSALDPYYRAPIDITGFEPYGLV